MPDYRLLIFDWDGTLVDSIGRIVSCMAHAASVCDVEARGDEAIKGIIGLGLPEAIATLHPELTGASALEAFRQAYAERYILLDSEPSALFAGVEEGLDAFREAGYLLAVATGKSRAGLDRLLRARGWQDRFDITRCADETASKPDPLMLREILAHCSVPVERALMIGDSVFDLQMARNAGMDSVAVGFGAQPLEILNLHGPRLSIGAFGELRTWLGASTGKTFEVVEHV
ncbi:HAD-IA family hydrolase [Pseudomonas sp. LRF_L74]|uniref:HAD-IA family hydrolase n=1 Tax=Pseudomonas sp. LRF_L74 TaxID=3369422 RepID=UPI003F6072A1